MECLHYAGLSNTCLQTCSDGETLASQAANSGGRLPSLSNTTFSSPLERGFFPNESRSSDPLVSLTMRWSSFSVVTHILFSSMTLHHA